MAAEEQYRHLKGWIRRLAAIDPPTGLLNRHGWIASAVRQLKRAVQSRKRVGIMLASVDHFSRLTEELGYDVGDELLQHLSEVLESQLRPGDLVGRWLEDQFIMLLALEGQSLQPVAERIRKAVESTPAKTSKREVPVTVCLGGAHALLESSDLKQLDLLISEADRRLEAARQRGRGQVVVSGAQGG